MAAKLIALSTFSALFGVACASTATDTQTSTRDDIARQESRSFDDVPEWVDSPPVGCGVGSTKYRGNRSIAREAATTRARADLARQVEILVQGMLKDYQAQGEAAGKDFTEERVTSVSRQLTEQSLKGSRPIANYLTTQEPREFYSLICLDPAGLAKVMETSTALSGNEREGLKSRAEAEMAEMETQLDAIRSYRAKPAPED